MPLIPWGISGIFMRHTLGIRSEVAPQRCSLSFTYCKDSKLLSNTKIKKYVVQHVFEFS